MGETQATSPLDELLVDELLVAVVVETVDPFVLDAVVVELATPFVEPPEPEPDDAPTIAVPPHAAAMIIVARARATAGFKAATRLYGPSSSPS
jgi:hypothetical protein